MPINPALEAARALALNPSLAPAMRRSPMPAGLTELLRLLAGDLSPEEFSRGDPARLLDVVRRYVIDIMLFPGAPAERVLGVEFRGSREQARAHMRLLMIWLHPDRAGDAWRAPYGARVLEAWRQISSRGPEMPVSSRSAARRPQMQAVKLAWVAQPVQRRRTRRRWGFSIALLAALAVTGLSLIDNPLWNLASSVLHANAAGWAR